MSVENSLDGHYSAIVREAHRHAYRLGGDPEIIDRIVPGLISSVLDANQAGLSREEIVQAVEEGLRQGELQCADPTLNAEYWEGVKVDVI